MNGAPDQQYRTAEFASLAGVTVRALHHYDRLGLLKPRRTGTGYRVYTHRDLERLEQIVALKFIGLPLKQIKRMLDRDAQPLPDALRSQRRLLEQKRGLLDRAIGAIREAERSWSGGTGGPALLKTIIEVIQVQDKEDWTAKYYTPDAQAKVEERKQLWSPELQERVSREWTELFRDVEAALDKDPASAEAQALARRWKSLVAEFTGGDPGIHQGLSKLHQDRQNWPDDAKRQMAPFSNPAVWEYMQRAIAAAGS